MCAGVFVYYHGFAAKINKICWYSCRKTMPLIVKMTKMCNVFYKICCIGIFLLVFWLRLC